MRKTTREVMAFAIILLISAGRVIYAQHPSDSKQTPPPSLADTEKWIVQTFTSDNTGRSDCQEYNPDHYCPANELRVAGKFFQYRELFTV